MEEDESMSLTTNSDTRNAASTVTTETSALALHDTDSQTSNLHGLVLYDKSNPLTMLNFSRQ